MYGHTCEYHKLGTCKFAHQADPKAEIGARTTAPARLQNNQNDRKVKVKHVTLNHPLVKAAAANRAVRSALLLKMKKDMSSYFDVKTGQDKSPEPNSIVERELKVLDDEFTVMRNTFRSQFQNHEVKFNLYQTTAFNVSAGGVLNATDSVDMTSVLEFAQIATLFDEFRVVGGSARIVVAASCLDTASNIPHAVIAYDPSDPTALTSLVEGCQVEQHHLMNVPVVATGFNTYPAPHTKYDAWSWKVPKGIFLQQVSGTAAVEGAWQSTTNGTPSPYGFIKTYGSTFQASVKLGLSVMKEFHVEFRCRT